ncbi:MAG: hypothetical protein KIT43_07805 [Bauldia sp.]|nr:hypothetical protein [Bauldia sp.]MCW5718847.1 hypothetical protein [Bauldia sp.]
MSLPEILFGLLVLEMFAGFPLADVMVRITRRIHRCRVARAPHRTAADRTPR